MLITSGIKPRILRFLVHFSITLASTIAQQEGWCQQYTYPLSSLAYSLSIASSFFAVLSARSRRHHKIHLWNSLLSTTWFELNTVHKLSSREKKYWQSRALNPRQLVDGLPSTLMLLTGWSPAQESKFGRVDEAVEVDGRGRRVRSWWGRVTPATFMRMAQACGEM